MPNDGSNGTLAEESLDGRLAAEKHATTGARWASVAQIGGDGRTDIRRQRQSGSMAAFSADAHLSGVPITIPQLKTGDFVRTHAESREQEHNRVIAPTDRRPTIESGEQLTHLLVPDRARDRGHRPIRHGGHRGSQVHRHRALIAQVPEEGTQGAGQELGAFPAQPGRLALDESHHVTGRQTGGAARALP